MDMEDQVREAIVAELGRQAEASDGQLKSDKSGDGKLRVQGLVDLDALAMAVVGSVAGGP